MFFETKYCFNYFLRLTKECRTEFGLTAAIVGGIIFLVAFTIFLPFNLADDITELFTHRKETTQ